MPNNETEKTASAPKRILWVIVLCAFLGTLGYLAFATIRHKDSTTVASNLSGKNYTLSLAGPRAAEQQNGSATTHSRTYYLSAASSESAQEHGLSGTASLGQDKGMLFVNSNVAERCFWMKDMRYPLDIIWADTAKKIVHIEKNLEPNTYPRAYCADAQYVIELNAGEADKNGMTPGQVLSF
jgi:uncharacterized membrane protein (UPF0127 family)